MSIALRPLEDLDQATVTQNLAETVARVQEANPHLDLRRGVFGELLAYYHSVLATQRQAQIADYLHGRSLKDIAADPTLADADEVDAVLSNFNITRQAGSRATGEVTIVLATPVSVTIAQNAVFTSGGKRYLALNVYTAKAETAQINSDSDRLLTRLTDGNYAFTVNVAAEDEGSNFAVKKDALVVPDSLPTSYVTSYAASDFSGGFDVETNEALLRRQQEGIAAKVVGGRANMAALLQQTEAFSRVVSMSIVGLGDAEMIRDRHWIWPISGGGRADWHLRSLEQVPHLSLAKTATLISKTAAGFGIWQLALGRDDAPGFYEIIDIRRSDANNTVGGFTITSESRALDLTGAGFLPDVANLLEGAYSRFQTAVIQFEDTVTRTDALTIGASANYNLTAVALPLIADLQDFVSSRDIRHFGADVLVRAPVPAFVSLSLVVYKSATQEDPDLAAIKDALAKVVNTVGFVGVLQGSALQNVVYDHLAAGMTVSNIDMFARLRYGDGSITYLRGTEKLTVPDDAANLVSARTVQFFTTAADIAVTVTTNVPTDL